MSQLRFGLILSMYFSSKYGRIYISNPNDYLPITGSGVISGSVLSSPSQGTVRLQTNGVNVDVDTGLQSADSPTFVGLTLTSHVTLVEI